MSAMPSANLGCRILAVAVLYEQAPTDSTALSYFIPMLKDDPRMASHFSLLLYDNSPQSQQDAVPSDLPVHYVHDPSNGGLAAAYNYALARAEQTGDEWLLLLDQDTTLTREFFCELLVCASTLETQDNVAAIVPKLSVQGAILSPAEHFIDYIRHQFSRSMPTLSRETVGVQRGRISAYNSGSTLRVSLLRSIGGFPKEFWLDYLDHAVFHALSVGGYQVYVLGAVLRHNLAESDLNSRPIWRFRNALKAQTLFVKRAGNLSDRLLYRFWLLRSIRRLRADCNDKRIWKETAMQALLFITPNSYAPVRPPALTTLNPH
jgi:GT2 family glycosyltransferase